VSRTCDGNRCRQRRFVFAQWALAGRMAMSESTALCPRATLKIKGNRMTKTYEIWQAISDADGSGHNALIEKGQFETQAHLFEGKPVLLKTFDAETYDEAAQIYNDYFGWGKYHPMKD